MSLIKTFSLPQHSQISSLPSKPKDSLNTHVQMEGSFLQKTDNLQRATFNGIMLRDQNILKSLNLLDAVNKHQTGANGRQKNSFSSISIKLTFQATQKKDARLQLTQYNIHKDFPVQFAFLQPNFTFNGFNFLKVNLASKRLVQSVKLFLCNASYEALLKVFSHQSIRFYCTPSANHQLRLTSDNYTIQQICSLDKGLCAADFEGDQVEYTASCTFNGNDSCVAIFTTSKVIILRDRTLLKSINKDEFIQHDYWIEGSQDWISFQSLDHLIVFQQRVKEVSVRASERESQRSLLMSNIQQNNNFQLQQQCKQRIFFNQTQLKNQSYQQMNKCFSHQPKCRVSELVEDSSLRKVLFGVQELMVDEKQQIEAKSDEFDRFEQCIQDQEQPLWHLNNYCSLIEEEHSSQMIDQSKTPQSHIDPLQAENSFPLASDRQIQDTLLQYNYNTCQSSIMNEDNHYQNHQYSQTNPIAHNTLTRRISKTLSQAKQNSINLNNTSNCQQHHKRIVALQQQQQYVSSNKERLLRLDFHKQNIFQDKLLVDFGNQRQGKALKFADIHQVSEGLLAGLTSDSHLFAFKKTNSIQFENEEIGYFKDLCPVKLFYGQRNSVIMSQQKDATLLNYDFEQMKTEKIRLPFQYNGKTKDISSLNDHIIAVLSSSSIYIIDRREAPHYRQIGFKGNQYFDRMCAFENTAVVGTAKGKVKIFDLRVLKPKSLNSFDLFEYNSTASTVDQFSGFKKIQILPNLNIFCQFNNEAFMIDAERRAESSIYSSKVKKTDRSFVAKYSIHQKIIDSINKRYHGQFLQCDLSFSIDKNGRRIVALYKNFQFHFRGGYQKLYSWDRVKNQDNQQQCFNMNFDKFSENQLISGVYYRGGVSFRSIKV